MNPGSERRALPHTTAVHRQFGFSQGTASGSSPYYSFPSSPCLPFQSAPASVFLCQDRALWLHLLRQGLASVFGRQGFSSFSSMFSWQLVLLLSCLAMLATCLPMVHEETASSSPSRPAPHHSLATMLYSLLVQEEAEDADISALP